jgi:DNA repair exonuclease SbcCD ATPase subunit
MIQDEETVALREHIKKLEESISLQEKRMEDQRQRLEEERKRNHERRQAEEEEFRKQAKLKEEELLKRITQMENRIKAGGGSGGGAPLDPAIVERLKKLESIGPGVSPDFSDKFKDIEKRLEETQKKLEEERKATADFFSAAPKEGPELDAWQKDMQIAWLTKANDDLLRKLNDTTSQIDQKIKEFSNMTFVGGGGGKPAPKSGLSYEDINAKLAEIQAKLFDPNTDERESEQLNIEYEKLITELESTPEYQKEQEEQKNKWRKENEAPNKEAFEKVYANLKAMPENKLNAVFKRKPELKFILRTPDQLLKAHVNDFKQVSTQNLLLIEARALYHNMPVFRKDQEQQMQFVQQLQQKI